MNIYKDLKKGLEQDIEIEKYQKKKPSSVSKSRAKSNHKHDKKECLLIKNATPYLASYCTICGKINNWKMPTIKIETGGYRMLNSQEVFAMYSELEQFKVDNLWNKYIPIVKGE